MSKVYDKSKAERYKKYFTAEEVIESKLSSYSVEKQRVFEKRNIINHWDTGTSGVPLYWNSSTRMVTIDHTDSHTLIIGPTGSKKSRLVVMPMVRLLGSTGESMIISDPKAEIYNRTASFLKKHDYHIIVINLRSPMHGNRWNPLSIPYEYYSQGEIDKACEFANDIAQNIILSKKANNDPFWDDSSGSFFFGLVLLLFKYVKDHGLDSSYVHIGNMIQLRNALFRNTGRNINEDLWNYAKEDTIIASALIGTVETANETRAGILSTFDQKTRMFSVQPNVLDMLGGNDFDLAEISNRPTAVFLIVPDEKTGYHGLVSLFIKQSYEYLINKAQSSANEDEFQVGILKNRLNYILDEFSSLPTIHDFPAMVTAARSRNIRFSLVIQSKHQLLQRYQEEAETIQTNCNNWIFLSSRELQLLEELSSLCGKTQDENSRPVLSVEELQRLDKDTGEALLLVGRLKPCITHLADISNYDNDRYEISPVQQRVPQNPPFIDLASISEKHMEDNTKNQNGKYQKKPDSLFDRFDVDDLVKRIDAKIAELEAEEALKGNKALDKEDNNEKSSATDVAQ